jgi:hypothetical protein
MIASPIYHRNSPREKATPTLVKYVSQRSLAVLLFIALALLASVGNKSSNKRNPGLSSGLAISQSRDEQTYLSLHPPRLVDKVFASVKDAFNDPALMEYANEQQIPDSLMTLGPEKQSISSTPNDSDPLATFASGVRPQQKMSGIKPREIGNSR